MTRYPLALITAGLCAALAATACKKNRGTAGLDSVVDRSDGTLPEMTAPQVAVGTIHVDGRLDESVWTQAAQTGAFVHPSSGKPESRSKVNASARIVWDTQRLYLGIIVNDPDPGSPFSATDIDPHLWERSSAIEVMIQPGDHGDNREYFEIQVDVNRAVWDTRFDDYNNPIVDTPTGKTFGHQEWVADVERAVEIDKSAGRYVIEMSVPWSALTTPRDPGPPKPGDTWRLNLYSFRDSQSDSLAWSPLMGRGNFHFSGRWGRLHLGAAK